MPVRFWKIPDADTHTHVCVYGSVSPWFFFLGGGGNQADGVHLALDLLQAFTTMAMDPYVAEDIARELSSSAVRGRLPSWLAPVPWTAR